ncbi:MAG: hypothetical protein KJ043_11570 [Anaerolineae bacterium]|nr:hypothetical protein [Anaerolineae bacterium]
MSKIILLFIGCALLCFIPAHTAQAATFDVCTLAELTTAITTANGNGEADTINFNCSTTLIFTSDFDISSEITINANGNTVIFDETGDDNRFFDVNSSALLTLNGLTLQNGNNNLGGAIFNNGGDVTITNSTFINNRAANESGAIDNFSGGNVTISNSTFINNQANNSGGAITNFGTLTISNSTFTNNAAGGTNFGGAIRNAGSLTVNNSLFSGNSAGSGGAIHTTGTTSSQDTHYENNTCVGTITDNGGNTVTNATGCPGIAVTPLSGSFFCGAQDLAVVISTGDAPFIISGSGPGFPRNVTSLGTTVFLGPSTWTGVTITEGAGDGESLVLGDITCTIPNVLLSTGARCVGNDLEVSILLGDPTFDITGTGPGLPRNIVSFGLHIFPGPGLWTGVTVSEFNGDLESRLLGDFNCPVNPTLSANAVCVGDDLLVTITSGEVPYTITGTGPGLPRSAIGGPNLILGPATWTGVTVNESAGDGEIFPLGDITCVAPIPISASATCIGADLQVTILTGDPNFQITSDNGTLLTGLGIGTHTITGPVNETNVNVTELAGDTENFALGNFNCFVSSTLTATATCNGANLDVTISNGNAPFTIDVNGSISTGNPLGVYNFAGPNTFTVTITEESGDTENLTLPSVTCTATTPPVAPAPAPILPPDPTALGCELTSNINLANAPDNTYCRILMKDGAVIGYSGAIPAQLINLGVILAVDVYRLEGGRSLTEFPNYARVCLSGQGRLFYMDSRNAPRVSIELQSENVDGLTCGWIPAPGTLILTN